MGRSSLIAALLLSACVADQYIADLPPADDGPGLALDPNREPEPAEPPADRPPEPEPAGEPAVEPPVEPEPDPPVDPPTDPNPPQTAAYCYSEPVDPNANVGDLQSGFAWNWNDTANELFDRRWPAGRDLLYETRNDPWLGAFIDTSSFGMFVDSLSTTIHEQTHGYDYEHALFYQYMGYFVRSDWSPQIDFHRGFARSEIAGMLSDNSTELYRSTYLVGTQGTYEFMELLDEQNCYINGLAALSVTGEFFPFGMSGRDGPLAFTYYLELYLRRARTQYPSFYAELQSDPQLHDLLITQWLRMHFFLDLAYRFPALGIEDQRIAAHVYANQGEIERLVGVSLDASPCLPAGETWQPPY